jgi:cell division septum initiation protein DivIVA
MTKQPLTPPQIRDADLPRALRGFDVDATRSLLADAAAALTKLTRERDDLRAQVQELSAVAFRTPTDAEQIGAVLLTAKRAGDDLIAKATEEAAAVREVAEKLRGDAQHEREQILSQARAEAAAMVRDAGAEAVALRQEAEELRRSTSAHREQFASFLRAAIAQLEGVESLDPQVAEPPRLDGELLRQLPTE